MSATKLNSAGFIELLFDTDDKEERRRSPRRNDDDDISRKSQSSRRSGVVSEVWRETVESLFFKRRDLLDYMLSQIATSNFKGGCVSLMLLVGQFLFTF